MKQKKKSRSNDWEKKKLEIKQKIKDDKREPGEMMAMIQLTYQDYEYRHKTFWELIYKSVFAVITIMTVPYFLAGSKFLEGFTFLFPGISALVCIFSLIIIKAEGTRMAILRTRMNILIECLSEGYKEISIDTFGGSRLFKLTNRLRIADIMLTLYLCLFAGSILEILFLVINEVK